MRSDSEVLAFYEARRDLDWMGTLGGDVLGVLPFGIARPFLKPDASGEEWTPESRDPAAVIERMRGYMDFAWDKATNHRGLSAGRSIDHFRAWLFLVGDDEMLAFAEDDSNYAPYGAPILAAICTKYGFTMPGDEQAKRMASGDPCTPHCDEGCLG